MHRLNVRLRIIPLGDTRLIGHHQREIAATVNQPQRLDNSGNQFDLVGLVQIVDLDIDHAVPIQKKRLIHHIRPLKCVPGQPDRDLVENPGDLSREPPAQRLSELPWRRPRRASDRFR